jgi:glycosyltransferase involved in cell wall biosynthesis
MPTTVLVEPDLTGHRFQAVANVALRAQRSGDHVVLLTSNGAVTSDAFKVYLSDVPLEAVEVYDGIHPPTSAMLEGIVARCMEDDVRTVVVMDADQTLKRWWLLAPRALRRLPKRPQVIFFLTRYPARVPWTDPVQVKLRLAKSGLTAVTMLTRTLDRAAGFAGRDDLHTGWLVKRARDPEICGSHSRDRAALRAELELPLDRRLVGVFGLIHERKNARLIFQALRAGGIDADLLLAGVIEPEVQAWVDSLPDGQRERVRTFPGFLDNTLLDKLIAAVDVAPIALTNNGPSGIMGKALAAGVPVVSAGSTVRARELLATDGGELAELEPHSLAAAIQRVFDRPADAPRRSSVPPATADEFAGVVLGR